jgi:signal transduction histidine kinase
MERLHLIGERRWLHGLCETIDGTTWACQSGDSLWSQRGPLPPVIITREQGLPNDFMVQTQADTRGQLWLQTLPESLYFAPLKDLREVTNQDRHIVSFRYLNRSDGVQAAPAGTSQAMSALDTQGRLWFTADRSLVMVDPAVASREILRPIPWVEKITADGESFATCEQSPGKPLQLVAGTRSFTIHFGGIGLAEPSRVRCRYRLRGVDQSWSSPTGKREVSYLCPAPGPYDFEVLATHEGEPWPLLPAVLHLQVQAALWQRPWFVGIAWGGAIGLILAGLHYRKLSLDMRLLAHEQQLYDERSRIARDLHDHLGASISSLRISVAASRQHLLQPAELTAHLAGIEAQMQASALQVDETIWLTNPKNDTLDAFCSYVVEYAQEFCTQTSTECLCELPGELPDRTLAGHVRHHLLSILKEALSNSVQHGKATQIELQLAVTDTHLTMIITDNGKPKDPFTPKSQLGGNGLKNMRARAEELGGTFEIGPHEKEGIRVRVVVPL